MRILDRYIFREILFPSLIALVALTFVAFLAFSRQNGWLLELIVRQSASITEIWAIVSAILPNVLTFTIPNFVLYVQNASPAFNWNGILLADMSQPDQPKVTFAQSGTLTKDDEHREFSLTLTNGSVHIVSPKAPDKYSYQKFDTTTLSL